MKTAYRPNAYWLRGALPTVEQSRDDYIGSVYGAAALAYMSIMHATEALDMLQERLPGNYNEVRRYASRITGTKEHIGETRKLELAIGDQLAQASSRAWMADFGNATYERVLPQVTALQTAIANALAPQWWWPRALPTRRRSMSSGVPPSSPISPSPPTTGGACPSRRASPPCRAQA